MYCQFQSTHPLRGATGYKIYFDISQIFQSTHPLRGATQCFLTLKGNVFISIHAPLAGCDATTRKQIGWFMHISIHAPLAGCDNLGGGVIGHLLYFNPRTPCGVRPYVRGLVDQDSISIHAPLAGCDVECGLRLIGYSQFQSTHPLRGATREALLVARWKRYFNPRTPCGVRPYLDLLSTVVVAISIHAPLAGCDRPRSPIGFTPTYFNPRTPCGVRRAILRP